MKIKILGSGTSVPSPHRMAPAYLLRCSDTSILLDCGSGSITSLVRSGVGLDKLTGVMLTHMHPDHTADLVPLLFALSNPVHPPRSEDLQIWGPTDLARYMETLRSTYGRWLRPKHKDVYVTELQDKQSIQVGDLRIMAFSVNHSKNSLAYRIQDGSRSLCISGDTGPCQGLIEAAKEVDVFICECAALEGQEVDDHLTATQLGQAAAKVDCGRVILTHLYEHIVKTNPIDRVRKLFKGSVEYAEDGMELSL